MSAHDDGLDRELDFDTLSVRAGQEFDEATALAMEFPRAAAKVHDTPARFELRRILLRSFPIKVIYTVQEEAC